MSTRETIVPAALRGVYDNWRFAPAVVAKGLIFCSGIIGTSVDGEPPQHLAVDGALAGAEATTGDESAGLSHLQAVRDPEAQFATAFEALRSVLGEAGASLSDVVEITTYHVDIQKTMELFMKVKDRYLTEPYPAWTAVGVSELVVPGGLMEIRAVALAGSGRKALA